MVMLERKDAVGAPWTTAQEPVLDGGRRDQIVFSSGAFLITLAMSLATIGRQALWLDEALTAHAVDLDWASLVQDRLGAGHFPTYFLFLKAIGLSHASDVALRIPSALAASGAAAIFASIALSLGGRLAATATALLFAFLPVLFYYSQEARPYALMLFFLALATAGQIKIVMGRFDKGRPGLVATIGTLGAALVIPAGIVSVAAQHIALLSTGAASRSRTGRRVVLRHLLITWVTIGIAAISLLPSAILASQQPRGLMKWQMGMSPGRRISDAWNEVFGVTVP